MFVLGEVWKRKAGVREVKGILFFFIGLMLVEVVEICLKSDIKKKEINFVIKKRVEINLEVGPVAAARHWILVRRVIQFVEACV